MYSYDSLCMYDHTWLVSPFQLADGRWSENTPKSGLLEKGGDREDKLLCNARSKAEQFNFAVSSQAVQDACEPTSRSLTEIDLAALVPLSLSALSLPLRVQDSRCSSL